MTVQNVDVSRKIIEDVAVNNVGGGNIAGTGVGPDGEPGVKVRRKKRLRDIIRR